MEAPSGAFAAFRVKSFRNQWVADLLTSWAMEMETLILAWYVLVVTDSVILLAVFGSLQFGGTLLSPFFGALADRSGRRRLLISLRLGYASCAVVLTALALTDTLATWHVFVIAVVSGLIRPSDLVVRNALIGDTVPESDLTNAMGLSRTTMDSARIAGTLVGAGLFSALGFGPSYLVVTALFVASALMTTRVAPGIARASSGAWRQVLLGMRYIRREGEIAALMLMAFLVNLTAFPISHGLLPFVAKDIYLLDANGLAQLMAAYAVGAMVGSLTLAWSGKTSRSRVVVVGILVWYALLLVFAQTSTQIEGLILLAIIGFAQSLAMIAMSVVLLTVAPGRFRGRVLGIRMMAVYGLPLGLVAGGALIDWWGFKAQASVFAVLGLLGTAAIAYRWRQSLFKGHSA